MMINEIKEITYIKKDPFGKEECYQIEISDEFLLKYNSKEIIKGISMDDIGDFITSLILITNNWNDQYYNKTIDGIEWQLSILYSNEQKIEYVGSGAYPNNFASFEKLLNDLFGVR